MKRGLLIFVTSLTFLVAPTAPAAGKEVRVKVKGMVCAFCGQGLTKTFKSQAAVDTVDVDLDKKEVGLKMKDGKDLPDAEIATIIRDAGFNLDKIER